MIETIYNKEENSNERDTVFHLPKNIKQVGEIEGNKKIYIEDYVITYVDKLAEDNEDVAAAVLVGDAERRAGEKYLFIRGAIGLKTIVTREDELLFTDVIWTDIYDQLKNYFDNMEIVGWYLGIPGCELGITNGIIKTHVDNFAGNDKVLLLKDTLQKEEAFFAYEENQLVMQKGYYVYYERNDAMQEYMISLHEKEEKKGEVYDDKVTRNIRAVLAQKKTETVQKRVMGFLYGEVLF